MEPLDFHLIRRAALCLAVLGAASLPVQAGSCAKQPAQCIGIASVVHAAGVDPDLLGKITFAQKSVQPQVDQATLGRIAAEHKAHASGQKLELAVAADAGLTGAAAQRQAAARAAALTRLLAGAGIPKAGLAISAR